MPEPHKRWQESMDRIGRLMGEIIEGMGPTAQAMEVLQRLGALDEMYRSAIGSDKPSPRRRPPAAGRRYQVDRNKGHEFLAEYRDPDQQPFRCPQETYRAFAGVMARIDTPASFEDLLEELRNETGEHIPDYLPRMCLRYWATCKPLLVERKRKRYRPVTRGSFRKAAQAAWDRLDKVDS